MRLSEAEALVTDEAPRCKAGDVIESLEESDRATFDGWITNRRSVTWISDTMQRAEITLHRDTLKVHLKGLCRCSPDAGLRGAWVD